MVVLCEAAGAQWYQDTFPRSHRKSGGRGRLEAKSLFSWGLFLLIGQVYLDIPKDSDHLEKQARLSKPFKSFLLCYSSENQIIAAAASRAPDDMLFELKASSV